MQRFVYVMAKDHHTDDPDVGDPNPGGMQQGSQIPSNF